MMHVVTEGEERAIELLGLPNDETTLSHWTSIDCSNGIDQYLEMLS